MNLGLLRPGRFVAAHVAAVLLALTVGLATGHLLTALAAAAIGLGLSISISISKAIVEAHDGRLSVTSVEGVGTTFFADLPAVAQRLQVAAPAA